MGFTEARAAVLATSASVDAAKTVYDDLVDDLWDDRKDMVAYLSTTGTYSYTNAARGRTYIVQVNSVNVDNSNEVIDIRVSSLSYGSEVITEPETLNIS